ncbi:1-phosphatidylinositol-4,5-bisphosphate phosphodiesteras-like protein 1 [Lentithecium fluviatile CBS 122367]|uniref:Phosphoinositide phospholipase C n=1 Tax=Lentithecium fluviatile CBS 122367 TaxID=1168545 RepID=A0A6G1J8A4_9PLEO|nr:1-phosphatidylinositol-4,5-bisphosphate phosphodiesteras-like protein 1 [Lentithecium fluviatile CBS 122367]
MSFLNGDHLKLSRPRMPSPQPSYARMHSAAISIPSSRGSPASTISHFGNGSLQSTPEGMVPFSSCSLPAVPSYALPESLLPPPMATPPTSSPSAMAEALRQTPGGLIRRVSRGAQGIPNRFRRNGSNAHRDKSSGPVIMRRRSDSRTAVDAAHDLSEFESYHFEEDEMVDEYGEPVEGLGITSSRPSVASIPSATVSAPKRNSRLEQGTLCQKATKRHMKDIILRLDLVSAKVCWDSSRASKSFYIDDIKDIHTGEDAQLYREELGYEEKYRPFWFTIVYFDTNRTKDKSKQMHIVAPDVDTFNNWMETLEKVSRDRIDMMAGLMGFAEKSAKLVWASEMEKRYPDPAQAHLRDEEHIDFPSIVQLCRRLHINCSDSTLRSYFDKADGNRTGSLDKNQFLVFVRRLKERKDVKQIFRQFTPAPHQGMDKATFFAFLQREQGVDIDANIEVLTATFEKFARASQKGVTPQEGGAIPLPLTMNFRAFQTFLASDVHNSVFVPISPSLHLHRPLNEYFISSSHNTYLLGRQVADISSTEAYVAALQKGCRCLEIDCWDGPDDKPIVTHGRTFTKGITFLDAVKVINKYAFVETEYPLILSLEVHCSPDQQNEMVKMMKKEFKEKLVLDLLNRDSEALPSPEELKRRILIKVKGPADELDAGALVTELSHRKRERSFSSPWSRPIQMNDNITNSPLISSPPSMSPPERTGSFWASPRTSATSTNYTLPTPAFISSAEESDSPNATAAEDIKEKKKAKKSKTSNITKDLGLLGVYTRGIKFSDFGAHDANTFNHVISFNERVFDKLTRPGAREKQNLEEHNMRCLMRIYPGGHRINSSNFDPLNCWRRGVQMAALNWQTYDLGQQLNEAMFTGGDNRTGYVLKPAELRLEYQTPVIGHRRAPKKEVKFTVQIISAQQLPRPRGLSEDANISPFVQFEMYCAEDAGPNATGTGGQDVSARKDGYSGIGQPLKKKTRIVLGNGYNPEFKDEIEMTVNTRYPDLVFVRWTVWNTVDGKTQDHAPLAQFTAKLNSIQQGYHHLPLFDGNGEQYLFSRLFCKIKKQDIVDATPTPVSQQSGSRRSSIEPISPLQDSANKPSGNFIKRLIRAPSERKKRKEERTNGDFRDSEFSAYDLISGSSTFER